MPSCCICGLEYAPSKTGVVFHKFSKNVEKRNYWIASIKKKIKNFSEKDATVICHQHFDKCYYMTSLSGKFVLKANAVPSIFNMPLKSKYTLNDQEEEPLESLNKELSNKTCLNIQTGIEKTENLSCSSRQQKSLLKRNFIVKSEAFKNSIEDISNKTCLNIQTGIEKTENLSCSSRQQKSLLKRNFIVKSEAFKNSIEDISNKTCLNIQTGIEKTENLSCSSRQQKSLLKRNFIVTSEAFKNSIEDISNKDKELKEMKEKNNLLQKRLKICQQKCRRYKSKIDSLTYISKEKLGKVQNIKRVCSKCNKISFTKLK